MKSLRIPIALDEHKKLCYPKDAERGKNYFCPSCGEAAIFRKGEIKIEHFAHKESLVCNQETITHITAKLFIIIEIDEVGFYEPSLCSFSL
jgi:competence CoiA-like predicted nuclease